MGAAMCPAIPEPIVIADYDPRWPALFEQEEARIRAALAALAAGVQHVGSTSVPGLAARPIVDIMIGVPGPDDVPKAIARLEAAGYEYRGQRAFPGGHFLRRRTDSPAAGQIASDGVGKTHHLHLLPVSHAEWERHILFRDYLRNHPTAAREYESLKRGLAARHGGDHQLYSEGKDEFVERCIEQARRDPPYPVEIIDYDPRWPALYEAERRRIADAIGGWLAGVEHVGSTSVPGLAAKPIIDIMPLLRDLADAERCIAPLEALGYEYVSQYNALMPERRYFQKGFPRTHHAHMVEANSAFARRHIAFRDYLRAHPGATAEYAALKRELAQRHRDDRFAYTEAKTDFIRGIEAKALAARAGQSVTAIDGELRL